MGPKGKGSAKKRQASDKDSEIQSKSGSKRGKKQKQARKPQSAAEEFNDMLADRAEQLGKFCLMLGHLEADSEDDESAPNMEQLQHLTRVYVPHMAKAYSMEVGDALFEIGTTEYDEEGNPKPRKKSKKGKEEEEERFVLRMLSTRHSYPMQGILLACLKNVEKAIKAKKWEEAFCRWVAALLGARQESHWYADTEESEEAEKIYELLRKQWVKLQKCSNEELGGLVCEGSVTDAKQAFTETLQGLADEMNGFEGVQVKDVIKKR